MIDKQYIYKLKIDKNDSYKIIDVGTVVRNIETEKYSDNMLYQRKETIGYYIIDSISQKEINIIIKINQDLGDKIGCKLELKSSSDVYYISQYLSDIVVDSIIIEEIKENNVHVATKIKQK